MSHSGRARWSAPNIFPNSLRFVCHQDNTFASTTAEEEEFPRFGALYLIIFATSILAVWLFQPALDSPQGYIARGGADNRIYFGRSVPVRPDARGPGHAGRLPSS